MYKRFFAQATTTSYAPTIHLPPLTTSRGPICCSQDPTSSIMDDLESTLWGVHDLKSTLCGVHDLVSTLCGVHDLESTLCGVHEDSLVEHEGHLTAFQLEAKSKTGKTWSIKSHTTLVSYIATLILSVFVSVELSLSAHFLFLERDRGGQFWVSLNICTLYLFAVGWDLGRPRHIWMFCSGAKVLVGFWARIQMFHQHFVWPTSIGNMESPAQRKNSNSGHQWGFKRFKTRF